MAITTPVSLTATPMANAGGAGPFSLTTSGTVPSGGTIIVALFWLASTPRTLSLTSTGLSPVVVGTATVSGNYGSSVWRIPCPAGATNPTISIAASGAVTHVHAAAMYSTGIDSSAPDDGNGGGQATVGGTSAWTTGAIAFTYAGEELQVVISSSDNSGTGRTATVTAPFTEIFDWENTSALQSVVGYRIVTNPGSTTAAGTWSANSDFADINKVVGLKETQSVSSLRIPPLIVPNSAVFTRVGQWW
jgi:hypothetical protein